MVAAVGAGRDPRDVGRHGITPGILTVHTVFVFAVAGELEPAEVPQRALFAGHIETIGDLCPGGVPFLGLGNGAGLVHAEIGPEQEGVDRAVEAALVDINHELAGLAVVVDDADQVAGPARRVFAHEGNLGGERLRGRIDDHLVNVEV